MWCHERESFILLFFFFFVVVSWVGLGSHRMGGLYVGRHKVAGGQEVMLGCGLLLRVCLVYVFMLQ